MRPLWALTWATTCQPLIGRWAVTWPYLREWMRGMYLVEWERLRCIKCRVNLLFFCIKTMLIKRRKDTARSIPTQLKNGQSANRSNSECSKILLLCVNRFLSTKMKTKRGMENIMLTVLVTAMMMATLKDTDQKIILLRRLFLRIKQKKLFA